MPIHDQTLNRIRRDVHAVVVAATGIPAVSPDVRDVVEVTLDDRLADVSSMDSPLVVGQQLWWETCDDTEG